MSDRHLRTSLTAGAVGLLLALAGCGDDGATAEDLDALMGQPAASPTPVQDPLAGAPTEGSCYAMSRVQSLSSTSTKKPVSDCYEKHNTLTYYVGTFKEGTTSSDYDVVSKRCEAKLAKATGLTKGQLFGSVLSWVWFEPTTTQWSAGARWFRCDMVANKGDKLGLLPQSSLTTDLFDGQVPDEYFRCIRRGPDTDGDGEDDAIHVTCDKPHDYRWAGWFKASGNKYPSRAQFRDFAEANCERIAGTQLWWATWPLEQWWDTGERRMSCYRNTSS